MSLGTRALWLSPLGSRMLPSLPLLCLPCWHVRMKGGLVETWRLLCSGTEPGGFPCLTPPLHGARWWVLSRPPWGLHFIPLGSNWAGTQQPLPPAMMTCPSLQAASQLIPSPSAPHMNRGRPGNGTCMVSRAQSCRAATFPFSWLYPRLVWAASFLSPR